MHKNKITSILKNGFLLMRIKLLRTKKITNKSGKMSNHLYLKQKKNEKNKVLLSY